MTVDDPTHVKKKMRKCESVWMYVLYANVCKMFLVL